MSNNFNYTDGLFTQPKIYPTGSGVDLSCGGAFFVWTTGSYTEVISFTPTGWILTGLVLNNATLTNEGFEIDVAVGPSGSEEVISTFSGYSGNHGILRAPVPVDNIPAGSRVSVRLSNSSIAATANVSLMYYEKPVTGRVTSTASRLRVIPDKTMAGLVPGLSFAEGRGTQVISGAGAWLNGGWTTIVAATSGRYVLGALEIVPGDDGHGVGSFESEMDIAVGSAGNEAIVTTIRPRPADLIQQPGQYPLRPVLDNIPEGVRVSARLRSAPNYTTNIYLKIHYYLDPVEDLSFVTTTEPQSFLPAAANGVSVASGATAWVSGAWVEMSASAPALALTHVALGSSPSNKECELDIAVGAEGFEQIIGTARWFTGFSSDVNLLNELFFLVPLRVAAGARVSVRLRCGNIVSSTTDPLVILVALGYVVDEALVQVTDLVHKCYPPSLNGVSVSGWNQLKDAVEETIYLTGLEFTAESGGVTGVYDLGVGALGSEQVVATQRLSDNAAMMQWVPFPVPIKVPSGTRLTVRSVGTGGVAAATYYGDLNAEPESPPGPEEPEEPYEFPLCIEGSAPAVIVGELGGLTEVSSPWDDCAYE